MRRSTIHIVLFLLTVVSTWLTWGPAYSVSVMLILLGHEMGHYLMSRRYGIRATLPYFLPLPFVSPFGTLGAVIRMESTVSTRKALFDTGVAGPLTGFFLSIPAVVIGLSLSRTIPALYVSQAGIRLADPLLFSLLLPLVLGHVPENFEVMLHPIGYAGWVGIFVTGLNLLPVGQLDGGHITYALFGRKSRYVFLTAIAGIAFIFIFYSIAWVLPLVLMIVFGLRHPSPSDPSTSLDSKRKWIGALMLLVLVLSFTPAPFPQAPSLLGLIKHGPSALLK
jgi:membrane-associated protease RseP (regulator of RpoE activity)